MATIDVESTTALLLNRHDDGDDDNDDYSEWMRPAVHWQNLSRQRSDRCMGVLTICCLLLLVLVVATVGFVCKRPQPTVCLEPRCIEATSNILRVMDLQADPCEDFYQYACGKYTQVTEIPEGQSKWSSFSKVSRQNKQLMRKLLEREGYEFKGVHSEALLKAKEYYHTCMNETITESAGGKPLLELLESLGGWSLLDNSIPAGQWNETTWDMTEQLIRLHRMRMYSLFTMNVRADDKNSSAYVMQFFQSGLGLGTPELYAHNDTKLVDAYIELGAEAVTLLQTDVATEHTQLKEEARRRITELVEFENTLSKLFVPKNQLQDPEAIYNKMPLQDVIDMIPGIDLPRYMAAMFGHEVLGNVQVVMYTPTYFTQLNQLLKDTPKRIIADYAMWYITRPFLSYLSLPFQEAVLAFRKVFSGVGTQLPLWQRCMSKTDAAFGFVTGALYVEENASVLTKNKTLDMIDDIRAAFVENLPLVGWMDQETRARAETKARAVKDKIGFPDWILDPQKLDEYHDGLIIETENNIDSMINILRFFKQKSLNNFGEPVDKSKWSMTPADVNAYYSVSLNQMVFPSGILQPPFFDNNVPMSINFGAIGMIMGHELTHGFDNQGRKFDLFGNLHDWWENKSAQAYEDRASCMVNQYSGYQVLGLNLDGQFTLGENIADNGGVKLAYMAYQRWHKANPVDLKLPLNLTSSQEFFLGMAQVWCSYYTPEYAQLMIYTDSHAGDKYRVVGSMSNLPAFSEAFQCPAGSPMNPRDKCQVW